LKDCQIYCSSRAPESVGQFKFGFSERWNCW
jgi:hypothetical protein